MSRSSSTSPSSTSASSSPPSSPSGSPLAARLARLRVPLGFVSAVLVLLLAAPTRLTLTVGAILAIGGEALRIWAAGHLNKSREVTSSGPYRYFAHPLYVGSSVMAVGVAIAAGSVAAAVAIALYMALTITAAIRHEEAFLREKFGGLYDRYREDGASTARRFSVRQAVANREYRAALGLVAAGLLLLLKATYNGSL
jgi:protein-S-isoprenylcysteine O-methyltransferase Ste14